MAGGKPVLTVHYSRKAERQLAEVYEFNIKKRGLAAADRYIAFLKTKIADLAIEYDAGKLVEPEA